MAGSWVVIVVVLLENTKADQKVAYWVASKEPQKVPMTVVILAEMTAPQKEYLMAELMVAKWAKYLGWY